MSRRPSEARCPHCRYAHHDGACFLPDGSDSWMDGYDAGRLAAVRADVERFVGQTDDIARDAQARGANVSSQARLFFATRKCKPPVGLNIPRVETLQALAAMDYRFARLCVDQAADCRRWLEETR